MTVKELREQLSKFDAGADVIVLWEDDTDSRLFDIEDVSVKRGTPQRIEGMPKFKYDLDGPVKKVVIGVTPDF